MWKGFSFMFCWMKRLKALELSTIIRVSCQGDLPDQHNYFYMVI